MKLHLCLIFSAATLVLGGFSARTIGQTTPASEPAPALVRKGPMARALETLTPEERQQFIAARKSARSEPEVIAARKKAVAARMEFRRVMKKALLQQDPALSEIFDKMEPAAPAKHFWGGFRRAGRDRGRRPRGFGIEDLTVKELQELRAARIAVKDQSEVRQAEKARADSEKAFRGTIRAAMIKANSSVEPIIDKVEAAMRQRIRAMRQQHMHQQAAPAPSPAASPSPAAAH